MPSRRSTDDRSVMTAAAPKTPPAEATVTGVQLMQGMGVQEARGFWSEAWGQVLRRPRAVISLGWIGLVALLAVFAPVIASGHPLVFRVRSDSGGWAATSPLLSSLRAADVLLLLAGTLGPLFLLIPTARRGLSTGAKLGIVLAAAAQAALVVVLAAGLKGYVAQREVPPWVRDAQGWGPFAPVASAAVALLGSLPFLLVPSIERRWLRAALVAVVATVAGMAVFATWDARLPTFAYRDQVESGRAEAVHTLIPWSPAQRDTSWRMLPPGSGPETAAGLDPVPGGPRFVLGTDALGQDVLSQMLHACRLSISIGLVSTGIAVAIGVTIGALMGYFGGWVDLVLYRVVETFMAIPVLFLLIVAAGVLPRNTYVMMAIIGCVTWTGAARFTRAEFMRLRSQDFVQSAKAVGLPLRSILFRHMLPNGVTPVLVDASFAIAVAIQIEAVLSFLGLGPADQASWGRLLASATNESGEFKWWLAIFPGLAIFLTALSYNLVGEALRDAIDPKLRKARV